MALELKRLDEKGARAVLDELGALLEDAVAGGDSVSFLAGLTRSEAREFFARLLPEVAEGRRVLVVAYDDGELVGSAQLAHAWQPNSPHRSEVVKLVVHRRARGRGIGRALMERLEAEARAEGRTLLLLDTVSGSAADRLYERLGWTRFGTVPGYALDPAGAPCDVAFFYKTL